MAAPNRPVWGADVPISMPIPVDEPGLVPMFGFKMTQYRLAHDLTAAEYEALSVPVFAPLQPAEQTIRDDADLDAGQVSDLGS